MLPVYVSVKQTSVLLSVFQTSCLRGVSQNRLDASFLGRGSLFTLWSHNPVFVSGFQVLVRVLCENLGSEHFITLVLFCSRSSGQYKRCTRRGNGDLISIFLFLFISLSSLRNPHVYSFIYFHLFPIITFMQLIYSLNPFMYRCGKSCEV